MENREKGHEYYWVRKCSAIKNFARGCSARYGHADGRDRYTWRRLSFTAATVHPGTRALLLGTAAATPFTALCSGSVQLVLTFAFDVLCVYRFLPFHGLWRTLVTTVPRVSRRPAASRCKRFHPAAVSLQTAERDRSTHRLFGPGLFKKIIPCGLKIYDLFIITIFCCYSGSYPNSWLTLHF